MFFFSFYNFYCIFNFKNLQEQPDGDKPDDDEDRKNPAYVPRKGAFYEHDFRDGIEGEEENTEKETPEDTKYVLSKIVLNATQKARKNKTITIGTLPINVVIKLIC